MLTTLRNFRKLGWVWCTKFAVHFWINPVILKTYLRPTVRGDLVRLGTPYGGWYVPRFVLEPGRVAYCAGAGTDISFDLELLERGLRVVTVDPTPTAVEHVRKVAPVSEQFVFVPVGLWDESTELNFHVPKIPATGNFSAVNLQDTRDTVTLKVESLRNLAAELGDPHIDVLKLDIEGSEHRVLASLLSDGLRPSVMCVEFDQPVSLRTVLTSVRRIQEAGYVLVNIDRWDYTFVLSNG